MYLLYILILAVFPISQNTPSSNELNYLEKTYLHTDRSNYTIGDQLFYKAYVTNEDLLLHKVRSKVLYVELIASDSTIIQSQIIKLINGEGHGDFDIGLNWKTGRYTIRAYTKFMLNFEAVSIFNKSIQIYGTSPVDTSPSDTSDNISVRFFPQGGHMVKGLVSVIGIKAENGIGIGLPIHGKITDDLGFETSFITDHLGFGIVQIDIVGNHDYKAIVSSNDQERIFQLPIALDEGYVLKTSNYTTGSISIQIFSSGERTLSGTHLTCQSHGKVCWSSQISDPSETDISFSFNEALSGILQFTLFNAENKPLAEVLTFNYQGIDDYNFDILLDKDIYTAREKVNLSIDCYDDEGNSITAPLSISITDSKYIRNNESNIQTHLLLQSDIKGKIQQPWRYFQPDRNKARSQMSRLLLIQGWRKFPWQDTLQVVSEKIAPEQALSISGRVTWFGKKNKGLKAEGYLSELSSSLDLYHFETDENGYFNINDLDIEGSANMLLQCGALGTKKKHQLGEGKVKLTGSREVNIEIESKILPPIGPLALPERSSSLDNQIFDFVSDNAIQIKYASDNWDGLSIDLEEIEIKADRIHPYVDFYQKQMTYSRPNQRIMMDKISSPSRFRSAIDILKSHILNIQITGITNTPDQPTASPTFEDITTSMKNGSFASLVAGDINGPKVLLRGGSNMSSVTNNTGLAKFMINGMAVNSSAVMALPPQNIAFIDVITDLSQLAAFGEAGSGGVISIYLKPPGQHIQTIGSKKGITSFVYQGYYMERTFYAPRYLQHDSTKHQPDDRITLYWNPNVKVIDGEAIIEFYTSDRKALYEIQLQGISKSGKPIYTQSKIEVK